VKRHILEQNGNHQGGIRERILKEVLRFLNSLTLIVIFMLVNLFMQKTFNIQWVNKSFFWNMLSFAVIQFLIVWMFSDTYIQEIKLHAEHLFSSREFHYYQLIGIDRSEQYRIYHKKYGSLLFWKLFVQNILFVVNINWFMAYAFNIWRNFKDTIGLTYAISFENIFTKIVHLDTTRTEWFNYIILVVLYGSLFAAYYFLQKKAMKEQ
jgi:hypothetical protein